MADFPAEQTICATPEVHTVRVSRARIARSATLAPCAAVVSAGEGRAYGAVSVYLERVEAPAGGALPSLEWELRARHSGLLQSEPIPGASGALSKFSTWAAEGSVVHVSGHLCLGFELWMKATGSGGPIPCAVRFVFSPPSCGPYAVTNGALV